MLPCRKLLGPQIAGSPWKLACIEKAVILRIGEERTYRLELGEIAVGESFSED